MMETPANRVITRSTRSPLKGSNPSEANNDAKLYAPRIPEDIPKFPVAPNSEGYGWPYAPQDFPQPGDKWKWKAGKRSRDGYWQSRSLMLPERIISETTNKIVFHKKVDVREFLHANFPTLVISSFFESFYWKIPVMSSSANNKERLSKNQTENDKTNAKFKYFPPKKQNDPKDEKDGDITPDPAQTLDHANFNAVSSNFIPKSSSEALETNDRNIVTEKNNDELTLNKENEDGKSGENGVEIDKKRVAREAKEPTFDMEEHGGTEEEKEREEFSRKNEEKSEDLINVGSEKHELQGVLIEDLNQEKLEESITLGEETFIQGKEKVKEKGVEMDKEGHVKRKENLEDRDSENSEIGNENFKQDKKKAKMWEEDAGTNLANQMNMKRIEENFKANVKSPSISGVQGMQNMYKHAQPLENLDLNSVNKQLYFLLTKKSQHLIVNKNCILCNELCVKTDPNLMAETSTPNSKEKINTQNDDLDHMGTEDGSNAHFWPPIVLCKRFTSRGQMCNHAAHMQCALNFNSRKYIFSYESDIVYLCKICRNISNFRPFVSVLLTAMISFNENEKSIQALELISKCFEKNEYEHVISTALQKLKNGHDVNEIYYEIKLKIARLSKIDRKNANDENAKRKLEPNDFDISEVDCTPPKRIKLNRHNSLFSLPLDFKSVKSNSECVIKPSSDSKINTLDKWDTELEDRVSKSINSFLSKFKDAERKIIEQKNHLSNCKKEIWNRLNNAHSKRENFEDLRNEITELANIQAKYDMEEKNMNDMLLSMDNTQSFSEIMNMSNNVLVCVNQNSNRGTYRYEFSNENNPESDEAITCRNSEKKKEERQTKKGNRLEKKLFPEEKKIEESEKGKSAEIEKSTKHQDKKMKNENRESTIQKGEGTKEKYDNADNFEMKNHDPEKVGNIVSMETDIESSCVHKEHTDKCVDVCDKEFDKRLGNSVVGYHKQGASSLSESNSRGEIKLREGKVTESSRLSLDENIKIVENSARNEYETEMNAKELKMDMNIDMEGASDMRHAERKEEMDVQVSIRETKRVEVLDNKTNNLKGDDKHKVNQVKQCNEKTELNIEKRETTENNQGEEKKEQDKGMNENKPILEDDSKPNVILNEGVPNLHENLAATATSDIDNGGGGSQKEKIGSENLIVTTVDVNGGLCVQRETKTNLTEHQIFDGHPSSASNFEVAVNLGRSENEEIEMKSKEQSIEIGKENQVDVFVKESNEMSLEVSDNKELEYIRDIPEQEAMLKDNGMSKLIVGRKVEEIQKLAQNGLGNGDESLQSENEKKRIYEKNKETESFNVDKKVEEDSEREKRENNKKKDIDVNGTGLTESSNPEDENKVDYLKKYVIEKENELEKGKAKCLEEKFGAEEQLSQETSTEKKISVHMKSVELPYGESEKELKGTAVSDNNSSKQDILVKENPIPEHNVSCANLLNEHMVVNDDNFALLKEESRDLAMHHDEKNLKNGEKRKEREWENENVEEVENKIVKDLELGKIETDDNNDATATNTDVANNAAKHDSNVTREMSDTIGAVELSMTPNPTYNLILNSPLYEKLWEGYISAFKDANPYNLCYVQMFCVKACQARDNLEFPERLTVARTPNKQYLVNCLSLKSLPPYITTLLFPVKQCDNRKPILKTRFCLIRTPKNDFIVTTSPVGHLTAPSGFLLGLLFPKETKVFTAKSLDKIMKVSRK